MGGINFEDLLVPKPGTGQPGIEPLKDSVENPGNLAGMPSMLMTMDSYDELMTFLTSPEHGNREAGGMLVGPQKDDDLITFFVPDPDAQTTMASYTPSAAWLNETLKKFSACHLDCKGLAHKHPSGCTRPSFGDLGHVRDTFGRAKNSAAKQFFMPIVCDGRLYPYVVTRDEPDRVQLAKLILI